MHYSALITPLGLLASTAIAARVVPGATWTDTSGNVIQGHGAGILKVSSTYYWFGEDKTANSALFHAVSCYSSTDLVSWKRQNDALTPVANTMISSSDIVERPKVIYNTKNSEYVMWFHSDTGNYGAAMVGVATATTPCGPYTYKASWQPLGADSRDESIYLDDTGIAYLLYASDNNQNFKITQLDSDFYNVTVNVAELNGTTLEAPGIIKRDGKYYLFASHTSGWDPNPNKVFTASAISGSWSSQQDIAPESAKTYYSQNAYDLPLGDGAIYMGDRWRSDLLGSSTYIWYPIDFSGSVPTLVHADVWDVDITAGTYSVISGTTYEAEAGTRSGNASVMTDSAFSGGKAVGYLGNGGSVSLTVQGSNANAWISLYYAVTENKWRNTTVSINGGNSVVVAQPSTYSGTVTLSVPVLVHLNSGSNTVTIGAGQSNYAGDLDKIIVYPSA